MRYAPVVIPTMNRYKHLKTCIESLKKNKHANETDLHISLDYPPSEKYEEGYNKVKKYLENGIDGFKNVYIYIQESNLGPGDNGDFLFTKVWEKEDRLIFTEDDNIFSENFLDYINKSLDRYEDDPLVIAIGGYSWPVSLSCNGKESYRTRFFCWWGCGIWKNKMDKVKTFNKTDIETFMRCKKNRAMLKKQSKYIYEQALYIVNDNHYLQIYKNKGKENEFRETDFIMSIYMHMNNKFIIFPYLSKVKNIGLDESGQNCNSSNYIVYNIKDMDTRREVESIDFMDLTEEDERKIGVLIDKNMNTSLRSIIKRIIMERKLNNTQRKAGRKQ